MTTLNGCNVIWILVIGLILNCGIGKAQRPQITLRASSGRAFGVNPARQASQPQTTPSASAQPVDFDCPEEFGYYPHPTDCSQYYVCVFGGALLESCTGGLMYSHELQTCDWPRNVGCEAGSNQQQSRVPQQYSRVQPTIHQRPPPQRTAQQEPRIRFTSVASTVAPPAPFTSRNPPVFQSRLPPPPELRIAPNPVITSRGQPKFVPNDALYAEEELPPVEEEESDRQQRVYRGQPSTIGQVQRDRDGIYAIHNINSLPNHGKVGSFAFNSNVQDTYRVETSSNAPVQNSYTTRPKVVQPQRNSYYNTTSTQQQQQYDPNQFDAYYSVYDEDVDLYRDVDYGQQYNPNSQKPEIQSTYRPVTTPTTTTPAPQREVYGSQKPSYRPVTYEYDDSLNGQIGQSGNQGTRSQDLFHGFNSISETPVVVTTAATPLRTATPKYTSSYATPSYNTVIQQQTSAPPSPHPVGVKTNNFVPTFSTSAAPISTTTPQPPVRTNTRTRGGNNANQYQSNDNPSTVTANRGTHPPRVRPTLKPSNSIVSKAQEFVDIYRYPPSRPEPIYPTPTPDKLAAKCRKDVCLLPDCFCGGKDIPGDLPVEQVPQIVLLTFDDSVNDLNKQLYTDLFEKGRVNPNGCPISATFYVSHEWTDYSQVQNLYSDGHEMASHTVSHSFGEQFSQKKWNREVAGQREILAAYGGVKLEDVRGMRAPFLSIGGNKMFKMLYDSNFTYDSSMPVYENRPPSWPYTLDYKIFHDCMIPPCPTKSYPGVWEVPMVMWQDLNGGRCSMGDACANPPDSDGVQKMLMKNFDRHYETNRAPFGLYYHAAWFTQPHHKEGFIKFLDTINSMKDVWLVTNTQALQWVRDPTPMNRLNSFQPFQCNYSDRPKRCNHPKVCNLWHKSGVRYMRTCQPCPEIYPWTGKTGIRSSRIDHDNEE